MTQNQIDAAAADDPDNPPLTPADFARMKRTPQVKIIRRALGLSQDDFAARYHIPIGTLRDWEQGRAGSRRARLPHCDRAESRGRAKGVGTSEGVTSRSEIPSSDRSIHVSLAHNLRL